MKIVKPAIVVVAFNRMKSLKRLLKSIGDANYINKDINLIISIDNGNNTDVLKVAEDFIWIYGKKEVVHQTENLGLKKHILWCGDLTKRYGSIILLEDDLYVSKQFYNYTVDALTHYESDECISQISLYKHTVNNTNGLKFDTLEEDSDIFFMQFASSWGQAWNFEQWSKFREWLLENDNSISPNDNLPDFVINWKETSWLKYFIKYNVTQNKFSVYPKVSLTSNFSDTGTNVTMATYLYQQPLLLEKKSYKFKELNKSLAVYDSFFELHIMVAKKYFKEFEDIEIDLYGMKKLDKIKSKYLLSVKKCKKSIHQYGMLLKPHEMNILFTIDGKDISLGKKGDFSSEISEHLPTKTFKYYWTHNAKFIDLWLLFKHRINQKIINYKKKFKFIQK